MPSTSVRISQTRALSAAASATAVVSEPPLPSVVISRSSVAPWKPATTGTFPSLSACWMRVGLMSVIRAREWWRLVRMPAWGPLKEIDGTPRPWRHIATSGAVMVSPFATSMSSSRAGASAVTWCASAIRRSVVWPIAETTATTCSPERTVSAMRRLTRRMRAALPTEVPPYFWTIKAPDTCQTGPPG